MNVFIDGRILMGPEDKWSLTEALNFHRPERLPMGRNSLEKEKKSEGIIYLRISR